ncbi:MAG: adenylate/guanylate cyclase domain-containing protein [Tepidiformaceae bacterium]
MTAVAAPPQVVVGAVVFTDIVGFTEYTAIEGDVRALELLTLQERLVQEALPEGARLVKELGDGLMLWFPDAVAAVAAALGLQARFDLESEKLMVPLWVRMGMHWGHQTRRRDDLVGHDVNIASRIVNVAAPGEVLVSEATVDAIGTRDSGAQFDEIGPVVMKGIPEPVRLFRATPD